jgi:5-methylcytosine-specific restriction endonuclease McrA
MIYEAADIQWVKSVKRDGGKAWAFFEPGTELRFHLTFSEQQIRSAGKIMCGEIILLFQRVDKLHGTAKGTYLTHLVTPIGNLEENPNLPHRFKWEREVLVIARAKPNDAITVIPSEINFGRVRFGRVDSIKQLSHHKAQNDIQRLIWLLFGKHLNERLNDYIGNNPLFKVPNDILPVIEGKEIEVVRKHIVRERNKVIVDLVKTRAIREGNGRVQCECCKFDFLGTYGSLGRGYIECHHRQFISDGGERETEPKDLALVCANCHQMLHRKGPHSRYYSIEELEVLIRNRNKT